MANRMRLEKNSIERAILIALVAGAVIISPMGSKVVLALARYYIKKWWEKGGPYIPPEKDPNQVRDSIYRLKKHDYVQWKYSRKKKIVMLELTKKGRKVFGQQKFSELRVSRPRGWDGRWRFVLFDIPEKSKSLREAFREKIKNMGFFQFQKSVWLYPYECEGEVRYVSEYLGVMPFVMTFTAKIDNDTILRKYFLDQGVL